MWRRFRCRPLQGGPPPPLFFAEHSVFPIFCGDVVPHYFARSLNFNSIECLRRASAGSILCTLLNILINCAAAGGAWLLQLRTYTGIVLVLAFDELLVCSALCRACRRWCQYWLQIFVSAIFHLIFGKTREDFSFISVYFFDLCLGLKISSRRKLIIIPKFFFLFN